jgi:hypothetical protein
MRPIKLPLVIIINGAGGVGKDSVCDVIANNYVTFVYSSITPIKRIAHYIGWDGEKTDKARKMLSDLKDICTEYNDLPFKYMKEKLFDTRFYRDVDFVCFHIREPEEIAKFRQYAKEQGYTCKTLLIRSERAQQSYGNHADDDVENYPYDMVYQNDGTLENLDKDFMDFWRKEIDGTC